MGVLSVTQTMGQRCTLQHVGQSRFDFSWDTKIHGGACSVMVKIPKVVALNEVRGMWL